LAKPGFWKTLLRQVATSNVGLLVNNAGFGIAGSFTEHPLEDELRMLDVNCRAALILAHEFANRMVQHRRGGIIMVSSVAAFQGVPFMSHYAATKAYDLILGEGLYHELKRFDVDVLTLCPGATATEFAQVAGGKDFPQAMAVAPVVAEALDALGKKSHVVTGAKNKLSVFATRLLPRRLTSYAAMQLMRRLGRSGRA
ncbi:MAG: SDR family NAD(P)-dependent oxidoreductase, partial [Leptospiraceae bacterium]|nr:SDR family NAD(P)-dependent oxidoreductase [Leptospiraceae bacterium]